MNTATPSLTLTDPPINIDGVELDDQSIMLAAFCLETPFGTEADAIEIRKVIDRMIDACEHVGHCELVSVTIARDYFELKFSTTDPFNTQFGLLEALSDVPFPEILWDDEDEDFDDDDECLCDDCLAAKQAKQAKQAEQAEQPEQPEQPEQANRVEGSKPKTPSFLGRIKQTVTNIFRH